MIRVLYASISIKQARDIIKAYADMDSINIDLNKLICMTKQQLQKEIDKLSDIMLLEYALIDVLDY